MSVREIFSFVAALLHAAGFVPYARAILRKEAKPAKASWLIWAGVDSIVIAGMYAEHSVNGQIVAAVLGAWVIALIALRFGTPGWTRLDRFCLGGAVLGIALWCIFSEPILGIVTSLSVVFLGSIPTFVSAWDNPSRENRTAWILFWLSCLCMVVAVPSLKLADAAQPITFLTIDSTMIYVLCVRARSTALCRERL